MHIHLGALDFITTALYVIVFAFIWNYFKVRWHNNVVGQAMSTIL